MLRFFWQCGVRVFLSAVWGQGFVVVGVGSGFCCRRCGVRVLLSSVWSSVWC